MEFFKFFWYYTLYKVMNKFVILHLVVFQLEIIQVNLIFSIKFV